MINNNEFNNILNGVSLQFEVLKNINIQPSETDGVYVKYNSGNAVVGACSKIFLSRALMLLAMNVSKGIEEFEINEAPHFDMCGIMLDMSRGAVLKVDAVKKYLFRMSLLGLNTLLLYLEDIYELKDYPQFGYMRGRYTEKELKEIDDYAYELGIEIVPCIETLGHMEQYLRWREASPVTDTMSILLAGSEDTYKLIETMIKTLSGCLRSRRINLGLDETDGLGLGAYLRKFGYKKGYNIILEHMQRISKICDSYGMRPMMWSDMIVCYASATGKYYDYDAVIPEEIIAEIPENMELAYWDYDSVGDEHYDKMIQKHLGTRRNIVFAGGIDTWLLYQPDIKKTFNTSVPGLKSCLRNGIKDVFATVWNGDGAECSNFYSLAAAAIYSEYCYRGEACTEDDIIEVTDFASGFDHDYAMLISEFRGRDKAKTGKPIMYGDMLFSPMGKNFDYDAQIKIYEEVLEKLKGFNGTEYDYLYDYSVAIFEVLKTKTFLLKAVRGAYEANDRDFLANELGGYLDTLSEQYAALRDIHSDIWHSTCKSFGWETMLSRYAFILARIEYVRDRVKKYLDGEIAQIDELEEELCDAVSSVPVPIYNRIAYSTFPVI